MKPFRLTMALALAASSLTAPALARPAAPPPTSNNQGANAELLQFCADLIDSGTYPALVLGESTASTSPHTRGSRPTSVTTSAATIFGRTSGSPPTPIASATSNIELFQEREKSNELHRSIDRIVRACGGIVETPTPAFATPSGSGFAPSPIVNGNFGTLGVNTSSQKTDKWGLILKTLDETDIGVDRLGIQPGGVSGWHAHPSPVFVTVTQGSVVWYDGSDPLCSAHTYSAGQSLSKARTSLTTSRTAPILGALNMSLS